MTKLTTIPLWQDLPFETTVPAERLPGRRPRSAESPDWEDTCPSSAPSETPAGLDWSLVVVL